MNIFTRIFRSKQSLVDQAKQAATAGDTATLKSLAVKHGAKAILLEDNPEELTSLHWAASSGSIDAVEFLLDKTIGADPTAARVNNFTPLHSAAMRGHAKNCEMLLAAGADINVQTDPQKYAPLHSAAFAGHLDTITLLINKGADLNLKNYHDERPVDTARRTQQDEAVRLLEAAEA